MNRKEKLFEIADAQNGFFSAKQAKSAGYSDSNFGLMLKSREWLHEERGLYRLARYPLTERPELTHWYLWSCDRKSIPQGIWSHETALDIHNLSDVMPVKMHMTVPKGFRRRKIPEILFLHFDNLSKDEIEQRKGYRVTTPLRTIIDVYRDGRLEPSLICQAVTEAIETNVLPRMKLQRAQTIYPEIQEILAMIDE